MKKLFFLAFLLPILATAQGSFKLYDGSAGVSIWTPDSVQIPNSLDMDVLNAVTFKSEITGTPGVSVLGYGIKCTCETNRDTTIKHEGIEKCNHEWVFAAHEDVNEPPSPITTADLSLCPKSTTTNEAKICSKCFRHETVQVVETWYVNRKKSRYKELIEQSEQKE